MDMSKDVKTWAGALYGATEVYAADVVPVPGLVEDAVGGPVGEEDVDIGAVRNRVNGWWGGGGIEAIDVPFVGEGPAAEFGLVGGGVDLFWKSFRLTFAGFTSTRF